MKIGRLLEVARLHGACEDHEYTPDTDIRDVRQDHITWAERTLTVQLPAGAFAMAREGYGDGYGYGYGDCGGYGDGYGHSYYYGDGYGEDYGYSDNYGYEDGYGWGYTHRQNEVGE